MSEGAATGRQGQMQLVRTARQDGVEWRRLVHHADKLEVEHVRVEGDRLSEVSHSKCRDQHARASLHRRIERRPAPWRGPKARDAQTRPAAFATTLPGNDLIHPG